MNQLVVTLIVVFLPGIIAAVVSDKITVHSNWNSFKFSLYAFILGISSYAALQFCYYFVDIAFYRSLNPPSWSHLGVWKSIITHSNIVSYSEVVGAVFFSLPVAFLAAFLVNYKIANKLAKLLRVSSKYGDENLFSYYLNAKEVDWIYVRDIQNNLTYQGRIDSYSENDHMQELVMFDVTVYRYEDSAKLYEIPTIYLTKNMGKFIIESIPDNLLGGN